MSVAQLCSIHTITHYRLTRTPGAAGGGKQARTSQGAKVCRIQPRSGSEDDTFESADERVMHAVYFATDPSAQARDQFDFVNGSTTLTLEVENVIDFNYLSRVWRVECIEMKKKSR